jgi:myosin-5
MSTTAELYTANTRVWIPDLDKVWIAAKLLEGYDPKRATLRYLTDESQAVLVHDVDSPLVPNPKLPPLRNPDILIGQNDLTALSYLNEPEVLYNLEVCNKTVGLTELLLK